MERRTEYSKNKLKNMFLRVLYEIHYGKMDDHSWDIKSIVEAWIGEYFNVELTLNEHRQLYEGIEELRSSNFISQDFEQGPSFIVLTSIP